MERLSELFGIPPKKKQDSFNQTHMDLAASIQEVLEECFLIFLKKLQVRYNAKNLCIAGGVGLNVKLNQKIRESGIFEDIFFLPLAGDNGLSLGAAALKYFELCGEKPAPLSTLGLGPSFTENAIHECLNSRGLKYEKPTNLINMVARSIKSGMVVGWFQGNMEFGPRAMGFRSILADATNFENKSKVNLKIKFREGFRPFCPSLLVEDLASLGIFSGENPPFFMIESFRVSDAVKDRFPAVVHIDNTTRPQAVADGTAHPRYSMLLRELKTIQGAGIVLNTSMNRNGEPVVCTPEEAIEVFLNTDMDMLVLETFVIEKRNN
jgi:carbamoyltransferase